MPENISRSKYILEPGISLSNFKQIECETWLVSAEKDLYGAGYCGGDNYFTYRVLNRGLKIALAVVIRAAGRRRIRRSGSGKSRPVFPATA